MDAQHFSFYIILTNHVLRILDLNSRNNGIGTLNLHLEFILE